MNRVYITDLDHTFLRSDLSISAFSKTIWNTKAKEATLSVATARSFYATGTLLNGLRIDAPMILLDGALVVTREKKIIDTKFLDHHGANDLIDEAVRFCNIHPFTIGLRNNDLDESFDYPEIQTAIQTRVLENYKDDPRLIKYKRVTASAQTFKVVYMGSQEELRPLTAHLKKIYGGTFEFKLSPENYTGGYFLTILHPLGDKAHALEKVAEYLNKPLGHINVFGDSINDIGMFKLAGNSFAVKNALEEVKAVAKTVLPHTNDEDAVANYLKTTMK